MTEYQLYPDVRLISGSVCSFSEHGRFAYEKEMLEIGCCSEGRCEYREGKHYYYLSPGHIIVRRRRAGDSSPFFPTGKFKGAVLMIDNEPFSESFSDLLEGSQTAPQNIIRDLCPDEPFIIDDSFRAAQVFCEICCDISSKPYGWLRLKTAELLIELSVLSKDDSCAGENRCLSDQAKLAEDVCRFACANLNEHYTIQQLAKMKNVNITKLKACFKRVYGCSIYSYVRKQKMYAAADLLRNTDRTVLDIACECGFDNGSKFAKAFREVMGEVPSVYRREYR